jgi:2-oxoglutarate ferredoxin oxidoreductase subunit gamma
VALAPDAIRIRLTGRGGQGIMLAGAILAEAAMRDGRHVTQIQEYGPEARLGATRADVLVADGEIAFPEVDAADLLLCLSRDGALRYLRTLSPDGLAVLDERLEVGDAVTLAAGRVVRLPLVASAREAGDEIATNVVGLGALAGLSDVVSEQSLGAALQARAKSEFAEMNARALAAGLRLGRDARALVASVAP